MPIKTIKHKTQEKMHFSYFYSLFYLYHQYLIYITYTTEFFLSILTKPILPLRFLRRKIEIQKTVRV